MCQTPVLKPTVWEGGQPQALPTAPFLDGIVGGAPGAAGNNKHGQVVGIVLKCDGSSARAVLWKKHNAINMGTIGGALPVPVLVNDKGQAVGTYTTTVGINHAFLWRNGVATDLGTLPGDISAEGNGINNEGQVVGQSCSTSGCKAFLWQNDVMTDLNALAADSSLLTGDPFAINARGQIVGVALQKTTGELRSFLATPATTNRKATRTAKIKAGPTRTTKRAKSQNSLCQKTFENYFEAESAFLIQVSDRVRQNNPEFSASQAAYVWARFYHQREGVIATGPTTCEDSVQDLDSLVVRNQSNRPKVRAVVSF